MPIETANKFWVSAHQGFVKIGLPAKAAFTNKADALLLAAWIVAMAETIDDSNAPVLQSFEEIFLAVQNT